MLYSLTARALAFRGQDHGRNIGPTSSLTQVHNTSTVLFILRTLPPPTVAVHPRALLDDCIEQPRNQRRGRRATRDLPRGRGADVWFFRPMRLRVRKPRYFFFYLSIIDLVGVCHYFGLPSLLSLSNTG